MLPTHTGVYEDGDDGLYAEVHMDSNPQYIAMAVESPAVPYGYHGYGFSLQKTLLDGSFSEVDLFETTSVRIMDYLQQSI